ncbi:MAG: hypothetical protein ABIH42_07765 [Planctomycetota bacterium]
MDKKLKLLLMVSLLIGMAMVTVPSLFAQEKEEVSYQGAEAATDVATGEIVSISTQNLSMIVKYLVDEELQDYRTATFYFDDTARIEKGNEAIKFDDLKVGDTLTMRYTKQYGWKRVVTSATVESKTGK